MSARKHVPRNGPARALLDADPDTPVTELHEVLKHVPRWRCLNCGQEKFTHPQNCSSCGEGSFEKRTPKPGTCSGGAQ